MSTMATLPVLLIIAHQGFQPIEYTTPKTILESNNIQVITASNKPGTATASNGNKATVDITTNKIEIKNYAGIFIVGGPGALENLDNDTTYALLKEAAKLGKPFGSICISTRILAKAGVIKDKKVTGWDGDNELSEILKKYNAIYIKEKCVLDPDGNIITATDPTAAQAFGEKIVEVIKK